MNGQQRDPYAHLVGGGQRFKSLADYGTAPAGHKFPSGRCDTDLWPDFHCPPDMIGHCLKIANGEYDIPGLEFAEPPRVLDIGANVGAFAAWASERWPGAKVRCYEPNPVAFGYLRHNVPTDDPGALQNAGVLDLGPGETMQRTLYFGKNNLGEASIHDLGEQQVDGVPCTFVSARDLPVCDVLKVDTEGCEVEILRAYIAECGRSPGVVLLEFHFARDRREIDMMLAHCNYTLVRARIDHPNRGILAYAHERVLKGEA